MFQAIDRFAQTKNIMRLRLINEAGELRHKDFFMEMAMKESVVDIKLMHWTTLRNSDREDSSDGGTLDHKAKCLMIIKAQCIGGSP